MKPDQPCIATATYAPHCGCPVRMEVKRGDPVPVCPRCQEHVEWRFLRSAYTEPSRAESLVPAGDAPSIA